MDISAAEFSRLLGVSRSHISKLLKDAVLKALPSGKLDLATAVRGYITYLKAGIANARVADQRAQYLAEQRQRLALKSEREAGRLMYVEDHDAVLMVVLSTVATYLNGFAGRHAQILAGMTDPGEIRRYVEDELAKVRDAMATHLEELAAQRVAELEA